MYLKISTLDKDILIDALQSWANAPVANGFLLSAHMIFDIMENSESHAEFLPHASFATKEIQKEATSEREKRAGLVWSVEAGLVGIESAEQFPFAPEELSILFDALDDWVINPQRTDLVADAMLLIKAVLELDEVDAENLHDQWKRDQVRAKQASAEREEQAIILKAKLLLFRDATMMDTFAKTVLGGLG